MEHRVTITLWSLATCSKHCAIGHLFGVARCTICVIVHETRKAIVDVLLKEYKFPEGDDLLNVVLGFKTKLNMIQCGGGIDGSHIPVSPIAMNHTDYYNRKGWYVILVQTVIDHN